MKRKLCNQLSPFHELSVLVFFFFNYMLALGNGMRSMYGNVYGKKWMNEWCGSKSLKRLPTYPSKRGLGQHIVHVKAGFMWEYVCILQGWVYVGNVFFFFW
jgi:hypothetical protein